MKPNSFESNEEGDGLAPAMTGFTPEGAQILMFSESNRIQARLSH